MGKSTSVRQAVINGKLYYVYDLDVDKAGKYKRVYGVTKSILLAKVQEWEKYREYLIDNIMKEADTFFDMYIVYIETAMTGIRRSIFQNHIPLIHEHLNISLKIMDKDKMTNFFEEIAPYRTEHALTELCGMMNDVTSFISSKGRIDSFEITDGELKSIIKKRNVAIPSYTIEDYEKVFEKCSQRILTGKRFKYGVPSIVIPFFVETDSSMKLSDVRWENVSGNCVFVPADNKEYEISDRLLQLICDFHAENYESLYKDGFHKEDIANIPQKDLVFPGGEHAIYHSNSIIKKILFHCGLPDNVRLHDFARQIQKAYEQKEYEKEREAAVADVRETIDKYSLNDGLADKLIQYAEKLFDDTMQ